VNPLSDRALWAWLAASFLLAFVLCALALRYARRRNLLDEPGRRRSHTTPTPRGGGIGIVVSVLAGLVALAYLAPATALPLRLIAALGLVAAIGWIDDHRPLSALTRLLVQTVAVGIWLWPLLVRVAHGGDAAAHGVLESTGVAVLLVFVCLWSINLHNFMDGIDGLLALQAIFVFGVLAALCFHAGRAPHGVAIALWAAATAGFVPYNFPRARLFMGDVGSGAIGLLIAVAAIWDYGAEANAASALIAVSAFLTDATATLVSRVLRGRRWYRAHREHLYQWLARSGLSHAGVAAWYLAWNLLVALPLILWLRYRAGSAPSALPAAVTVGLYLAAGIVWIGGKRWCLSRVRNRRTPVHA
jgi:UDP-N-acetylmuramyl pentapeptide phosphotransferase/UDP-N-acetylglucosamine-1-phosphate transferase